MQKNLLYFFTSWLLISTAGLIGSAGNDDLGKQLKQVLRDFDTAETQEEYNKILPKLLKLDQQFPEKSLIRAFVKSYIGKFWHKQEMFTADDAQKKKLQAKAFNEFKEVYEMLLPLYMKNSDQASPHEKILSENYCILYLESAGYLANCYKTGCGAVMQDNTKARDYFLRLYDAAKKFSKDNNEVHSYLAKTAAEIGSSYAKKDDWEKAPTYYEQAYRFGIEYHDNYITVKAGNMLGVYFMTKGDLTQATEYFLKAYSLSQQWPFDGVQAANNMSLICITQGKYAEAQYYADAAYKLSSNNGLLAMQQKAANSLGLVYMHDKGTIHDEKKAIEYFKEAYGAKNTVLRGFVLHNLGVLYLYSKTERDLAQAKKYLEESVELTGASEETRQSALSDLYVMKHLLFTELDGLITDIQDQISHQTIDEPVALFTQAIKKLSDIRGITISFRSENDRELENDNTELTKKIDLADQKLQDLRQRITAKKSGEWPDLQQPPRAESDEAKDMLLAAKDALEKKDFKGAEMALKAFKKLKTVAPALRKEFKEIFIQYGKQKLPVLLSDFESQYKAYLTELQEESFNKAIDLLHKVQLLAVDIDDRGALLQISLNYEELQKKHRASKKIVLPQGTEEKIEVSDSAPENYVLLDPFGQRALVDVQEVKTVDEHLRALSREGRDIRGAKKISGVKKAFNIWRIRAGGYRILYTILDNYGAVVIITIDKRDDVYENFDQEEQRAQWLHGAAASIDDALKEIDYQRKQDDREKELALIKLCLRRPQDLTKDQLEEFAHRKQKLEMSSSSS